jgi:hypothetical protein
MAPSPSWGLRQRRRSALRSAGAETGLLRHLTAEVKQAGGQDAGLPVVAHALAAGAPALASSVGARASVRVTLLVRAVCHLHLPFGPVRSLGVVRRTFDPRKVRLGLGQRNRDAGRDRGPLSAACGSRERRPLTRQGPGPAARAPPVALGGAAGVRCLRGV